MTHNEYLRGLRDQYDVLREGWTSVPNVMRKTGVSRQTVYSRNKGLQKLGVEIESSAAQVGKIGPLSRVYRVAKSFDKLFELEQAEIEKRLGGAAKASRSRPPKVKRPAKRRGRKAS